MFEYIHMRAHLLCGWAIVVDPGFESEFIGEGEVSDTLWIHHDEKEREIFATSMKVTSRDGTPWTPDDFLSIYPPAELSGDRHSHSEGGLHGKALWFFGDSDTEGPSWVLMTMVANPAAGKLLRCTIVTATSRDRSWALETWRNIGYPGEEFCESIEPAGARDVEPGGKTDLENPDREN